MVSGCEISPRNSLNSFSRQIILFALHAPYTPTSSPNKQFVGVKASATIGIPFNKQHYLSI